MTYRRNSPTCMPFSHAIFTSVLIFLFLAFWSSCSEKTEYPYANHYYPYNNLEDTLVYKYREESTYNLMYQVLSYNNEKRNLHTEQYNANGIIEQVMVDDILSNGVLREKVILYDSSFANINPMGQLSQKAKIIEPQIFSYNLQDSSETLLYHIEWKGSSEAGHKISFIKNRYCYCKGQIGKDRLRYEIKGAIDDRREGTLTLDFEGHEIYARDTGLISYVQTYGNGLNVNYRLVEILSIGEWRNMMKEK